MTQDQELIERLRETQKLFEKAGIDGSEGALQAREAADMIEALRAQLKKAREVKPLVWEPTHIQGEHLRDTARDMDGRLRYEVGVVPGNHYLMISRPQPAGGLESLGPYPSECDAKAAAQADYQRRYNAMSAQEGE